MSMTSRQLRAEVIRIREARPLHVQAAIARSGVHPVRGTWWPKWIEYTHVPNMMRSILTRFTKGPLGTGRMNGLKKSPAKHAAVVANARKPRPRARGRARKRRTG